MALSRLPQPLPLWEDGIFNKRDCVRQSGAPKSSRKQHRSCDQCRKGKRRCDANILPDAAGYHEGSAEGKGLLPLGQCSNCAKTGKNCTFVWLRSQEQRGIRRKSDGLGSFSKHARANSAGHQSDVSTLDLDSPFMASLPSTALDFLDFDSSTERNIWPYNCENSTHGSNDSAACNNDLFLEWQDRDDWASPEQDLSQSSISPNLRWNEVDGDAESMARSIPEGKDTQPGPFISAFSRPPRTGKTPKMCFSKPRTRREDELAEASPFGLPQRLALSTNKSLVTESLLKVYHDSLENALSCWLTERTCPYGIRATPTKYVTSTTPTMLREWGPNWSNRICTQVVNLDRTSAAVRDRPMTRSEDRAASKALNLAIMAFATQWSQSSERSRKKYQPLDTSEITTDPSGIQNPEMIHLASDVDDTHEPTPQGLDFDRNLQHSFYNQARQAIQDATHIESFRVVFAHIIFALTQKPLDAEEVSPCRWSSPCSPDRINEDIIPGLTAKAHGSSHDCNHATSSTEDNDDHRKLEEELENVIHHDGPPVFLEQGLRHIHSLRSKIHTLEAQSGITRCDKITTPGSGNTPSDRLTQKNRETVDLLYWLAVMFDTLSAAMHKRPLVISDEDSDVRPSISPKPDSQRYGLDHQLPPDTQEVNSLIHPTSTSTSTLWDSFFLEVQQPRVRSLPVRWPCSYESAAATLADAAPIKVLLFRKVTRIQTLLSRHILQGKLEVAIENALHVYSYWNSVFGPFILDCISHHDQLPPRIQSWYICLTGHWQLAILLLADLVQTIDESQLGLESHRCEREASSLVNTLRQRSANAVADLARCSCPREDASFSDSPDFHFAVNKGALLTEPWTQVLIRVFSKAGALLLGEVTCSKNGFGSAESCRNLLQRSEECVEALWYLGRKSDMAFLAAKVLAKALKGVAEIISAIESSQDLTNYLGFPEDGVHLISTHSSNSGISPCQDALAAEFGLFEDDATLNMFDSAVLAHCGSIETLI